MTLKEARTHTGLSATRLRDLLKEGALRGRLEMLGGRATWLVERATVEELIRERLAGPRPGKRGRGRPVKLPPVRKETR